MTLVVETALELNRCLGVPHCEKVGERSTKNKAHLLRAVMGLRWPKWSDMVDDICTDVYHAWNSPELVNEWDDRILVRALFARFGLDDFCALRSPSATLGTMCFQKERRSSPYSELLI